jgi:hypothetical protein
MGASVELGRRRRVRTWGICSSAPPILAVGLRRLGRGFVGAAALLGLAALSGGTVAGQTPLQQTNGILWALIIISVIGAIITYGFLAYALWKYRDPRTKGRRYG